nr:agamous-like MADS-box protein AGL80 [Tanacetum cinerariifolium]
MTRKEVKLAFIANDSARIATFKKRKKGLMKKAVAAPPPPSLPSRPQATVGANTLSSNNDMMARGLVMHGLEKRNVVPNLSAMDGLQRTQWFTDWLTNPSDHNLGLGPGPLAIMSLLDDKVLAPTVACGLDGSDGGGGAATYSLTGDRFLKGLYPPVDVFHVLVNQPTQII